MSGDLRQKLARKISAAVFTCLSADEDGNLWLDRVKVEALIKTLLDFFWDNTQPRKTAASSAGKREKAEPEQLPERPPMLLAQMVSEEFPFEWFVWSANRWRDPYGNGRVFQCRYVVAVNRERSDAAALAIYDAEAQQKKDST